MCGIVGFVHHTPMGHCLLNTLRRLEYRGYDSSGMGVCLANGELMRFRSLGSIEGLVSQVPSHLDALTGIGHTRWATHGVPSVQNAHPQASARILVIHNGTIMNYSALKHTLQEQGIIFESETDTEVIAHLLEQAWTEDRSFAQAMACVLPLLEGSFALACVVKDHPLELFFARQGTPPLILGRGLQGYSLSSDALGLAGLVTDVMYIESGQWGQLHALHGLSLHQFTDQTHLTDPQWMPFSPPLIDHHQGGFDHFMRKEISEQPDVIRRLIAWSGTCDLPNVLGQSTDHITLVGCGTSYYAAWMGQYVLESTRPVRLELASEFNGRKPVMIPGTTVALSQSGETADTIQAMLYAKDMGQRLISVVNVEHSSLARLSHDVIPMQAGIEIGVASTKAFIAQVWLMYALAGLQSPAHLPEAMEQTLALEPLIQQWAFELSTKNSLLYLGRGLSYPIALEGALKMKELAYIHAEGLAGGELKHGSLALIDDDMPLILLLPSDDSFEKSLLSLCEIRARSGLVYVITDPAGEQRLPKDLQLQGRLIVPHLPDARWQPLLHTLVLQLLAYHTALYRGCSIDRPRHLAKSVTVE
jgi:glucosamine--fructose-6-phosphate aminotransferase (isomerizing)